MFQREKEVDELRFDVKIICAYKNSIFRYERSERITRSNIALYCFSHMISLVRGIMIARLQSRRERNDEMSKCMHAPKTYSEIHGKLPDGLWYDPERGIHER